MWIAAKEGEKVRLKGQLVQLRGRRILYVAPADPGPFGILPRRGNLWVIDELQPAFSVRNRRNFRQVESKDLCWSSPP